VIEDLSPPAGKTIAIIDKKFGDGYEDSLNDRRLKAAGYRATEISPMRLSKFLLA
jgi:hypothetical protein